MSEAAKKKTKQKYHSNIEEYIPYAAHFDEETLITKNGELLQVIKIAGFAAEANLGGFSLRDLIRKAIQDCVKTDNFAFWIHTIRAQRDVSTEGVYKNDYAKELNEKWISKNNWRSKFVNELYLTILINGESLSIKNPRVLVDSFFSKKFVENQKASLIKSSSELNNLTNGLVKELKKFGCKKLSIFKKDGIYYSEIIGFFSKIMNLRETDIPLSISDLSLLMPTHKIIFQNNTIQVEGPTGKHFGAVFSIKEYHEITTKTVAKLLNVKANIIISQSVTFTDEQEVIKEFSEQKRIYDISGNKYMSELTDISEFYSNDKNNKNKHCQHQLIITIIEDTLKSLNTSVSVIVDLLREIGLVFIREDLFMESCYWSMLPGNFDFIKRNSYILTNKIAGLSELYNFTTGTPRNNFWGNAVTALPGMNNNPYFFNFHHENNGNLLVFSSQQDRSKIFVNFLLSQSQKFGPRIYILENGNASKNFIETLGGDYHQNPSEGNLNPENLSSIAGFDLSADQSALNIITQSILNQVNKDTRTIIAIDCILLSQESENVRQVIKNLVEKASSGNLVCLFLSTANENELVNFATNTIKLIATKIFLDNQLPYQSFCGKVDNGKELESSIKRIKEDKSEFLINRSDSSVLVKFDISDMQDFSRILFAKEK